MSARIAVIGARGHTGAELLRLIGAHPQLELVYAASRAAAGRPVRELAASLDSDLIVAAPNPDEAAAAGADVAVLAMPNGAAAPYVAAFDAAAPDAVLIDLSADYRHDPAWAYGLPEHHRAALKGARRIANPGCYATAAQLALRPLAPRIRGRASVFGVSGYSGAGTTPNPRNDPQRVADNLMPYALAGHGHEAEIRRHGGVANVDFTPHVAGFFRGLTVTLHAELTDKLSTPALRALYEAAYGAEPMIALQDAPAEARDGAGRDGAVLGGFLAVPEEARAVVSCALDNLLKGAATQALQNINLALGWGEGAGLTPMTASHPAAITAS